MIDIFTSLKINEVFNYLKDNKLCHYELDNLIIEPKKGIDDTLNQKSEKYIILRKIN